MTIESNVVNALSDAVAALTDAVNKAIYAIRPGGWDRKAEDELTGDIAVQRALAGLDAGHSASDAAVDAATVQVQALTRNLLSALDSAGMY